MVAAPLEHLAQNVLKDAAVLVVSDLERRIDAGDGGEVFFFALRVPRAYVDLFSRLEIPAQTLKIENLDAGKSQGFEAFAGREFHRQHTHAHEIAAVNSLETFGEDRSNSQKQSSLGSPVARRTRAVFFPRNNHQRDSFFAILH